MHRICYNEGLVLSPVVVENNNSNNIDTTYYYNSVQKKKRRAVGFYADAVTIPLQSPLDKLDSIEEWSNVFYKATDLHNFREEARALSRQMRILYNLDQPQHQAAGDCSSSTSSSTSSSSSESDGNATAGTAVSPLMAQDPHTRGLEHRTCLERQRRRYFGIRLIVRASRSHTLHPDQLALYAHKCTHWATQLAAKEAVYDFVRAWFDNPSPSLSTSLTPSAVTVAAAAAAAADDQPSSIESVSIEKQLNKRPISSVCGSVGEAQRCVRRKTS